MSDKYKYKSISLRNQTYSTLGEVAMEIVPGTTLSKARTVEKLINDWASNSGDSNHKKGFTNAGNQSLQKI